MDTNKLLFNLSQSILGPVKDKLTWHALLCQKIMRTDVPLSHNLGSIDVSGYYIRVVNKKILVVPLPVWRSTDDNE